MSISPEESFGPTGPGGLPVGSVDGPPPQAPHPRIRSLAQLLGNPNVPGYQRMIDPQQAVFLQVAKMDPAIRMIPVDIPETPDSPQRTRISLDRQDGVVAYISSIGLPSDPTTPPPTDFSRVSYDMVNNLQATGDAESYETLAIGDGQKLPAAYYEGLGHNDQALAEPIGFNPSTVGDMYRELERRRRSDASVVIGSDMIGTTTPGEGDCTTYPLPQNDFQIAALMGSPDNRRPHVVSIPEGRTTRSVRVASNQKLLGWLVFSDEGILVAGSAVGQSEPSYDPAMLVVTTFDQKDLLLRKAPSAVMKKLDARHASSPSFELDETDTALSYGAARRGAITSPAMLPQPSVPQQQVEATAGPPPRPVSAPQYPQSGVSGEVSDDGPITEPAEELEREPDSGFMVSTPLRWQPGTATDDNSPETPRRGLRRFGSASSTG